jgi:hypothetical protein
MNRPLPSAGREQLPFASAELIETPAVGSTVNAETGAQLPLCHPRLAE